MEPMRGRWKDNDKYVEKEGDLTTWGQKPDQGRRTDIVGLKRKLIEGHHPMDLAIEDKGFTPKVAKFSRFASELYQHARFKKLRINREVPEVYIRIGPPGTGKSRKKLPQQVYLKFASTGFGSFWAPCGESWRAPSSPSRIPPHNPPHNPPHKGASCWWGPCGGGALENKMFKKQVSVQDLACMLATIDVDNILLGSTMQLTQKSDGCVSMLLLPDKTQLGMCTSPQRYRLLQPTDAKEWPFVPKIRLRVLLQDLQNRRQNGRWGLFQNRISRVSVRKAQCRELACVHEVARYVLHCLKLADARAS